MIKALHLIDNRDLKEAASPYRSVGPRNSMVVSYECLVGLLGGSLLLANFGDQMCTQEGEGIKQWIELAYFSADGRCKSDSFKNDIFRLRK